MFDFLKKNRTDLNIYAPVDGQCIDITDVNDKTFSSKLLGDGFAIIPTNGSIKAPCDGIIKMIFLTKHAFGIQTNDGQEILIHIGIDTVNLNGEGFTAKRSVNDKIKKGDVIITLESSLFEKNIDLTTIVIMTKSNNLIYDKRNLGSKVISGDCILQNKI